MLNTIAMISLVVSILSAGTAKVMEIFGLTEGDLGSIILQKQEAKDD